MRVIGLAAAVAVLAPLGTACGSRTSMLDSDAYGSDSEGVVGVAGSANAPGSGTAGKSTNGTGAPGRAGSSSTTPAGGAANSLDPTLALSPCQQYCPGYGTQCKPRLEGKECLSTCQGELNGYGTSCQTLGINALLCLTPFFSANGGDCNAAVNRALAQCGMIVAAFDSCKKGVSGSSTPSTPSKPISALASCPRSGGGDATSCVQAFACNEGSYVTFCSLPPGSMLLDCGCVSPNGQMVSVSLPPSSNVCVDAAAFCQ